MADEVKVTVKVSEFSRNDHAALRVRVTASFTAH